MGLSAAVRTTQYFFFRVVQSLLSTIAPNLVYCSGENAKAALFLPSMNIQKKVDKWKYLSKRKLMHEAIKPLSTE